MHALDESGSNIVDAFKAVEFLQLLGEEARIKADALSSKKSCIYLPEFGSTSA